MSLVLFCFFEIFHKYFIQVKILKVIFFKHISDIFGIKVLNIIISFAKKNVFSINLIQPVHHYLILFYSSYCKDLSYATKRTNSQLSNRNTAKKITVIIEV